MRELLWRLTHNQIWTVVGAGRLGQAIAGSDVFADHGFNIAAVFDSDPAKAGTRCGEVVVSPTDDLQRVVHEKNIIVGVIAVPAAAAQDVCDALVASGIKIVFNYSGALLSAPWSP